MPLGTGRGGSDLEPRRRCATPHHLRRSRAPQPAARASFGEARRRFRRSRGDARLERLSPSRALLRRLRHGRGMPYRQSAGTADGLALSGRDRRSVARACSGAFGATGDQSFPRAVAERFELPGIDDAFHVGQRVFRVRFAAPIGWRPALDTVRLRACRRLKSGTAH